MPNRLELEQAIDALEAQRAILGDDVVETSLKALRQKVDSLKTQPVMEQFQDIPVLVADLSNYTAMSEAMDAEEVGDTINALWEKLDRVIESWGGLIDKHTGDGLIALFGLPIPGKDDHERAILAALDMQTELALFNESSAETQTDRLTAHIPKLQMRIGIDRGPLFFGAMGISRKYTAVGEAVSMASQLQQLAPVGGTLISYELYAQVHYRFEVEALDPVALDGRTSRLGTYVVKGEKPRLYQAYRLSNRSNYSRMIGRQAELERMQEILQMTLDRGKAHFLNISGQAGVGKSRLIDEFDHLLEHLPMQISHFRGQVQPSTGKLPFALMRDLFTSHFGIHVRSSANVAQEKLIQGLMPALKGDKIFARKRADLISQLLELDICDSKQPQRSGNEAASLRQRGVDSVIEFFRSHCLQSPVTIITLENIQWADPWSLDLIEQTFHECRDLPLLIIYSGRCDEDERQAHWQALAGTDATICQKLNVRPLSAIDTRHQIADQFQGISQTQPLNTVDLIVEQSAGIPGYIEELAVALKRAGILIQEEKHWRLQLGSLRYGQSLPTLAEFAHDQLTQLSTEEQEVMRKAAVLGQPFSRAGLAYLCQQSGAGDPIMSPESILDSLADRGLILGYDSRDIIGSKGYQFAHEWLYRAALDDSEPAQRASYHALAAAWLKVSAGARLASHAHLIGYHFEKAGEAESAAEWFGLAGTQAKDTQAPLAAIAHFSKALALLPDKDSCEPSRVSLNQALAETYLWQGRQEEAVKSYQAMQIAARASGNTDAQARAMMGTLMSLALQGRYSEALQTGKQAEEIARALGSRRHLAAALAAKSWALMRLSRLEEALEFAREAFTISNADKALREVALSSAVIGLICLRKHWYQKAIRATESSITILRQLNDPVWEGIMVGNLGAIAFSRGEYTTAAEHYRSCLQIALRSGNYLDVIRSLRKLAQINGLQGHFQQAENQFRQAYLFAAKSLNHGQQLKMAFALGELYFGQTSSAFQSTVKPDQEEQLAEASAWLELAAELAESLADHASLAAIHSRKAQVHLEKHLPQEALSLSLQALKYAWGQLAEQGTTDLWKIIGISWRTLGTANRMLSYTKSMVTIENKAYETADCFKESLIAFEQMGRDSMAEAARTLYAWAVSELSTGDEKRGKSLMKQAHDKFKQLGMSKEAQWIAQFGTD